MIQYKNWHEVNALATKAMGKPSVYINNGLEFNTTEQDHMWFFVLSEVAKLYGIKEDCRYEDYPEYHDVRISLLHGGLFFFDNEKDQYDFYRIFEQPLTDSSAMYACTYDKNGVPETENT